MASVVQRNFRIRNSYGQAEHHVEIPNLIDLQKKSYEKFLQMDKDENEREETGLQAVFKSIFPIEDFTGNSSLEFEGYRFEEPAYNVTECLQRASTYQARLKVKIRKVDRNPETGEISEVKESEYVFMGEVPLQTDKGTFIINGTERVVVSQLHRSPGAFFGHDSGKSQGSKLLYNARIIPYRGSWLDFEFDAKDILHVRIDRRRKMHATVLLRAMGYTTQEILKLYYPEERIEILPENPNICRRYFYHKDYLQGAGVLEQKTLELNEHHTALKAFNSSLKLNKVVKSITKQIMRPLPLETIKEDTARIRGSEARCATFLKLHLGDGETSWLYGETVIGEEGEVLVTLNEPVTYEGLIQLSTYQIPSVNVYAPEHTATQDVVRVALQKEIKGTDASEWALSRPITINGEEGEQIILGEILQVLSSTMLLSLHDANIKAVDVHATDGIAELEFVRSICKVQLKSDETSPWSTFNKIVADKELNVPPSTRLNVGVLVISALYKVNAIDVYRGVTFNAPHAMRRKFGIDITDGYVLMKTDDLKGWVLAEDVYSSEGELLKSFNEELTFQEDLDRDDIHWVLDHGVNEVSVFFIDDNHFSHALRNTLRHDQGKASDLDQATADHPLVNEMYQFIDNLEREREENPDKLIDVFGYRRDLSPPELANIANSLRMIYNRIRPGDPAKVENSYKLLRQQFFADDRYDLSEVGRVKLNHKFKLNHSQKLTTLTRVDVVEAIRYILALRDDNTEIYRDRGDGSFSKLDIRTDDIDHLGNRRVRAVGELMENQYRIGLVRMERTIKERMQPRDEENRKDIKTLINSKPVVAAIKEYFGSSQLSQFMDQTNPLSEVTHKRRLSALGPGGLNRDRAGFEVRDVHMTHYGRICPIETPEGPNIGLIASLSTFAKINDHGFIETPYRRVRYYDSDGQLYTEDSTGTVRARIMYDEPIEYYNALDEEYRESLWDDSHKSYSGQQLIAQAKVETDDEGWITETQVSVRSSGDFLMLPPSDVDLVDVSPNQLVSVAASLIPFLENDDANRALMGSNMQRQAVPLLVTRAPLVGTGMEITVGRDSGVTLVAQNDGIVDLVDAERIVIRKDSDDKTVEPEIHNLLKFRRSNQNTCINQRPIVERGDRVKRGDIIADGPGTEQGELALGRNVVVAFMPWGGYNFEDSILISERLVQDDVYTSIHIEEFECAARDTKLGPEEITRDIHTVSEDALKNLDESGIVRIGAEVQAGDILVGKTTPKGETQRTPEERLLRAIFGEKAEDVRDTSLRVRTGVIGTVIGVKVFDRKENHKDARTVSIEYAEEAKLTKERDVQLSIIRRNTNLRVRELLVGQKASVNVRDESSQILFKRNEEITLEKLSQLSDEKLPLIRFKGNDSIADQIQGLLERLKEKEDKISVQFQERVIKLREGDELPPGVLKMVKVYVAIKRKLQVGDKMAGRHGNKGVISRVLPIEDMPFLEDGTPVEMVLNPLGVPSRMNIGQILETHLGWAARGMGKKINRMLKSGEMEESLRAELMKYYTSDHHQSLIKKMTLQDMQRMIRGLEEGVHVATPVFDGAPESKLNEALEFAELRPDARSILFNGRTGEPFDNPVTVGVMYVLKLHHLVDEKIHARSTGPYSLVTQQPLGGKAQFGGQRLGEMEVWAMEAYGAAYTLQEFLTVKSDDIKGRTQMYESIVKGEYELNSGLPESFRVLIQELKSLALDIELMNSDED